MTTMLPLNQTVENPEYINRVNYRVIGFRDAGLFDGNVEAYDVALNELYSRFISKYSYKQQQLSEQNFNVEIMQNEIIEKNEVFKKELNRLVESELVTAEKERDTALSEYHDFKSDPKKFVMREKDPISTWIYGTLSFMVALFLYFFYSAVVYSALFMEIKASSSDAISYYIFYPYALEEAFKMGFSTTMLVIIAPFVFLAIGVVAHTNKYKPLVIGFAFIADGLLAYHISEKIYEAKAINIYSQVEKFDLFKAALDVNFWTIIALGFGVYILFGILFTRFWDLFNVSRKINEKEAELKSKINGAESKVLSIRHRIEEINNTITENQLQITTFQKGPDKVYFNVSSIIRILSDYTLGWQQYLSQGNYNSSKINTVNSKYYAFITTKGLKNDEN